MNRMKGRPADLRDCLAAARGLVAYASASGIAADDMGTIYTADVGTHGLRKYLKVK
jgi:hypothetical protein